MTQSLFMHGLGYASLIAIFCLAGVTAVATIARSVLGNTAKISAALRGQWHAVHHQAPPVRPRPRVVAVIIPESTKMRDAA